MTGTRVGVIFVHGFLSAPTTWQAFDRLIDADPALPGVRRLMFGYASPKVSVSPVRRIPNVDDIADSLATFVRSDAADHERLVLVSHSQGGLVVQRFLARTLAAGRGHDLAAIRRIVMFACPNAGSQIALLVRKMGGLLWRNPQERELRPLTEGIVDAQRIVLNQVVHTTERAAHAYRIPIVAYAGESDGVVPPASARSVFPDTGVLPGDHFSIIQPDSPEHRSYTALRRELLTVLGEETTGGNGLPADGGRAREHNGDGRDVAAVPPIASVPGQQAAGPAPSLPTAHPAGPLPLARLTELVDLLLAVPRMTDPAFRHSVYDELPPSVAHQLRRDGNARVELFALVRTFEDYAGLRPWDTLVPTLDALMPGHPAVAALRGALAGLQLVDPR